jgi:hypothetical protein
VAVAYTSVANLKTYMGVSDSVNDAAFTAIATAVNDYIEDYVGFPVGSGGTAIRTYDGDGSSSLFVRGGVQGVTTLEVADRTGGTFATVTDFKLRPASHERPTGWPAWHVILTDLAPVTFTQGYDTVRITPSGGWDFAAVPPKLSRIADTIGVKMFQSRQTGETMVVGSNDFGQAVVARFVDPDDREYLDHLAYTVGGRRRAT